MALDYRTTEIYICGMRFELLPSGKLKRLRGSGQPRRSNVYGEPTVAVRVPVSLLPELENKMRILSDKYAEFRRVVDHDVLYTTPGYTLNDLDRVIDEGRSRRWN